MLGQLRGWEWVIIAGIIVLLFGAKRMPDAARGLGRSLRIFKSETKGLIDTGSDSAVAAGKNAVSEMKDAIHDAKTSAIEPPAPIPAPEPIEPPAPVSPSV